MEDCPSPDRSFLRSREKKPLKLLEIVTAGLQHNATKKLKHIDTEDKGRGIQADEDIRKQEFVVEYKYSESYPLKEKEKREKEYIENGEGCFVLDVQLPNDKGWLCLDATRNPNCWGRYLNHSPSPNLKMFRPVLVRKRWRVGFTALRDIKKGEELCYDYGRQKNQPDWMRRKKKSSLPPKQSSSAADAGSDGDKTEFSILEPSSNDETKSTKLESSTMLTDTGMDTEGQTTERGTEQELVAQHSKDQLCPNKADPKHHVTQLTKDQNSKILQSPASNTEEDVPQTLATDSSSTDNKDTAFDRGKDLIKHSCIDPVDGNKMDLEPSPKYDEMESTKPESSTMLTDTGKDTKGQSTECGTEQELVAHTSTASTQDQLRPNKADQGQHVTQLTKDQYGKPLATDSSSTENQGNKDTASLSSSENQLTATNEAGKNPQLSAENKPSASNKGSNQQLSALDSSSSINRGNKELQPEAGNCTPQPSVLDTTSTETQDSKKVQPTASQTDAISDTICESCVSGDKAEVYCNTCESPLCHRCVQQHSQSKALKKHTLVPLEEEGPICESCVSGDKAEVYCNTCESPLCHSCVQQHNQSKALKKHTLVPLENAKQGPSCESCASGDKAEVYCSTCERSLCYNCIQRHNRSKVLIKHFLIPLEERRVIAKCELCSARPPEGHCLDCNNHLCSPCIESHRRMKIFQSHIVVSKEKEEKKKGPEIQPPRDEPIAFMENSPPDNSSASQGPRRALTEVFSSDSEEEPAPQKARQVSRKILLSSDSEEDQDLGQASGKSSDSEEEQASKRGRVLSDSEDSERVASDLDDIWLAGSSSKRFKLSHKAAARQFLDNECVVVGGRVEEDPSDDASLISDNGAAAVFPGVDAEFSSDVEIGPIEEPQSQRRSKSESLPPDEEIVISDNDDSGSVSSIEEDSAQLPSDVEISPLAEGEEHKIKRSKRREKRSTQKYRKYRQCPVQDCTAKPQKKLSQHLLKYHPNLTGKDRRRMLKIARIVARHHLKTDPSQTKLPFKPSHLASTSKGKDRAPKGRALTKGLSYFPSTHPELAPFKDYLMGLAGRKRKEKIAESIVRDISKMLYFYHSQSIKWEAITDRRNLLRYMDHLDELKMGPEGQLTKLERACDLLQFLRKTYGKDDADLRHQILETENEVQLWKRTLRTQKKALQVKRLEELSEQDLSLDEITAVVDNPDLWLRFSEIVDLAKYGEPVSDDNLKLAMGIIMISVTLVSYSRPGAIANCTVDEYRNAVTCEGSTIIKVHSHKTGSKGSAKLTIDEHLTDRLRLYFTYIRPLLIDQGHDIPNLFILPGSKKIDNFSNLHSFLKKHLAIDIPSATKARKIGATCAARSLDYQTNSLVTKQMSHDPDVSRRYYEALQGPSDAAFAFQQMEALRKGESTSRVQYAPVLSQESSQSTPKPTTPAPSSRWTPRDTVFIQEKFARYIKNGKTPTLSQCEDLGLGKSSKQIQDKVRTLIRRSRKAAEAN